MIWGLIWLSCCRQYCDCTKNKNKIYNLWAKFFSQVYKTKV